MMYSSLRPFRPVVSLVFIAVALSPSARAERLSHGGGIPSARPRPLAAPLPDYSSWESSYAVPVDLMPPPKAEPGSGFVKGGVNNRKTIESLTAINGNSIEALEKRLRPGASSQIGFMGKDESLRTVLADDNDFVLGKKTTHQQLARELFRFDAIAADLKAEQTRRRFTYKGVKFEIQSVTVDRGYQDNPFAGRTDPKDPRSLQDFAVGQGTVILKNLDNGKVVSWARLVPFLIGRYGFYEGKGTSYRVDPAAILSTLSYIGR